MNIFILDQNPKLCAEMHCNKHVVKMVLETAQMLSTIYRQVHGDEAATNFGCYKSTHAKHPCTKWVAADPNAARWLCELGLELCNEYTYRYNRVHKTEALLHKLHSHWYDPNWRVVDAKLATAAQAMPDQYKVLGNPVAAYQAYYLGEKTRMLQYTRRQVPEFIAKTGKL